MVVLVDPAIKEVEARTNVAKVYVFSSSPHKHKEFVVDSNYLE